MGARNEPADFAVSVSGLTDKQKLEICTTIAEGRGAAYALTLIGASFDDLRTELEHWQGHARSAGWRLPVVEPEHQAARRAAMALLAEHWQQWATSAQDWQFGLTPQREMSEQDCEQLRASVMWGPLVACGAALGALV